MSRKRVQARTVSVMAVDYQATLRRHIRAAMAAKGWTPKHLAKALRHPHPQTVNRWLADDAKRHRAISIDNVEKIAMALGVVVRALDPDGTEAYDPSNRPVHMRRGAGGNTDTRDALLHTPPALLHSGKLPVSLGGSLMPEIPDVALFHQFTGLWVNIEHSERLACLDLAESFVAAAHARKHRKAKNR